MLNLLFRLGLQQMYGPAAEKVREAFCAFLQSCPLAVRLPDGVFITHSCRRMSTCAGFDTTIFDRELDARSISEQGGVFQLVWGRDYREENARALPSWSAPGC